MKRCHNCGNSNEEAAKYCMSCGRSLTQPEPESGTGSTHGAIAHYMVSTTFELPGQQIQRNLGLVRGIVVRSRSIIGTVGASLQTLVGGDISLFSELCENTRSDAFERMLQHAAHLGANAVVGVRYDATEIMNGVTEVLAYGTAVVAEPKP
jgi:uncharacterized protein YbjQ (UPF0145 family)